METLRLNDTGWNPNSQSQRHTDNTLLGSGYNDNPWPDYIAIGITSAPLDELRTRDNLSFLAQSSNARHVADGFDVKLNATYQADRLDFTNSCTTRYFDKNIPSFLEQNTMRNHNHQLNGEWSLQLNRRNNYLKDNLNVDALWNRATSAVNGTQALRQQSDLPVLDITNDLQLVYRIDSHLLTISSHNRYSHRPHSLTADSIKQDLTTDDFRSVTEARYGSPLSAPSLVADTLTAHWLQLLSWCRPTGRHLYGKALYDHLANGLCSPPTHGEDRVLCLSQLQSPANRAKQLHANRRHV